MSGVGPPARVRCLVSPDSGCLGDESALENGPAPVHASGIVALCRTQASAGHGQARFRVPLVLLISGQQRMRIVSEQDIVNVGSSVGTLFQSAASVLFAASLCCTAGAQTPVLPQDVPAAPVYTPPEYVPAPTPADAPPGYVQAPTPADAPPGYMQAPTPADAPPGYVPAPAPAHTQPGSVAMPSPVVDPYQSAMAPAVAPRTSIRQVFAGTLAAVATATGATLAAGLTQVIVGGITNWFSRRTGPAPSATPQPSAMVPAASVSTTEPALAQQAYQPSVAAPVSQEGQMAAYPPSTPSYAQPGTSATMPPPVYAMPAASTPQFFDPRTGASTVADPAFFAPQPGAAVADHGVYAGIAYEVHAIGAGGAGVPVDPARHEFRTGERFVVHYRPALPGRMEVYNINPVGQQTLIDSVELAAGQLATLGPYEFAALTGDEQLRLVLTPCSTPALLLATRDIVKVATPVPAGSGLGMASCGPVTRSIDRPATRDIRKVALDGTTAFALDPVSASERSSGQFASREVTILFRHR